MTKGEQPRSFFAELLGRNFAGPAAFELLDASLHALQGNGVRSHQSTVQGDTTEVFALLDELSADLLTPPG